MKKYALHILYVSLLAIFVFGFTYLPLQDFPVLIYQGFVFNEMVFHGNTFGGFFHFHSYIPPNAVSTVILGVMDIFMDPFAAGKIYIFLLAAALYWGMYRYLVFHLNEKRAAFASIAFFLTVNIHFLMSYLNFLTGLALVFHAIVFIRQRKYETRILPMGIAVLVIYLCHFIPLALFGLYFSFYFIIAKNYSSLRRFVLSAIPTMIIFIHYLLMRNIPLIPGNDVTEFIDIIKWKFFVFFQPLIPFNVFKWVREIPVPFRIADYAYSVILLIFILFVIVKNIIRRIHSLELWLAIVTFVLALFLPRDFGGVIPAGERFVAFCIINLLILFFRDTTARSKRIMCSISFMLAIITYSYVLWNTSIFNTMIAHNEIPQIAVTHNEGKLEGVNGFLHQHFYEDIRQKNPYPFFNIGLFEYLGSDNN